MIYLINQSEKYSKLVAIRYMNFFLINVKVWVNLCVSRLIS